MKRINWYMVTAMSLNMLFWVILYFAYTKVMA